MYNVIFIRDHIGPVIESVRTPAPITPYPTGRLVWGALSQALRARSPSQTTAHPKPWTCATNRCDRDVGLAESGYDHAVPPGHFAGSSHAATAHGTALITYQTVSYTCGAATLWACVPGVRPGLRSFTTRRSFDLRPISQQPLARGCCEIAINACWPGDVAPNIRLPTAKRSEIIAQAFRPGNQYPRKCAPKGRQMCVSEIQSA